ncbi:Phosphatidylinositol 3-kinase catalytic subunit type 3 [Thelohanellus kitauei]|uniref:Phosphatidylinositol 3-kinase catalytic subunit type 3 n=1 Tax=Thelohanellus kitauei TaxID=669202 RepID=A0A0C2JT54_THEKT|nr:Phosphatidylinositol 3-kinase catalytic subunit type 3 [Thelohanellus kitauei]
MPIKFCFETENQTDYNFILKVGDDMRQDQVILTMINILNKILLHENIDLKLTPYKVIAITPSIGLIEFISSISVAEALSNFGTIQNYFRTKSPDPDNIDPEIMENYVKSCAGYSVITYLFGVGDRHLDNLLITPQGKLFHIDFSYILGRDPKPYPPPIKLSTEMVDGMGGLNSKEFEYFLKLCTLAFIHLRRQSHTIINVFSLLVNSNLGEISAEPDKAVMKLFEKFRLDLDDVEAQSHLITLIYDSHKAVFAPFVEKIHKLAQKWRQ